MAGSRFTVVAKANVPYLGDFIEKLSNDVEEIENSGVQATGNIDGSQITTGLVPAARLGTGTADGTTVLYGDGTWKVPTASTASVAWVDVTDKPTFATVATSGAYADLTGKPDLSVYAPKASPSFTGTVSFTGATVNGLTKSTVGLGNVDNTADAAKQFAASQITSGVFPAERLGTGAAGAGDLFLADDGTYKAPPTTSTTQVITSGPYTLDPKRAPADSVVLLPAGTTVLTHIGNRFTGQTAGTTPNTTTMGLSGTFALTAVSAVNFKYADAGLFGENVQVKTTATATDTAAATGNFPTGITDILVSIIMQFPTPTADTAIVTMRRTSGLNGAVYTKPGSAAGTFVLMADDSKNAGGWNYITPDIPGGSRIRISLGQSIGTTGTDGRQKFAFYRVHDDGTETQIGTTYEVTGISIPNTEQFTQVNIGKLTGQASLDSAVINIDAVRVAYGSGAYDSGLLTDERKYPEAI